MAASMIPPDGAPQFLADHGWAGAEILPLAGDASFRRYFRIVDHAGARHAVLMDAPPPHEDPRPFVAMAQWLGDIGLVAPVVLAKDLDQGLLLLDDLGDARLRETLDADPSAEQALYETAVDVLVHLHREPPPPALLPHGLDQWLDEIALFLDWYVPAVELGEVDRAGWRTAWHDVLSQVADDGLGPVTVLRDYHAENIMLLDGRGGIERFGLLDFQDALAGHPAYDLVSVLEDARRDVAPCVERAMIDRYRHSTGAGEDFEAAYWALAAQRNTRILGVFCRLWKRDGKDRYKAFQPRMWGLLERDLAHPSLGPVKAWFDANVPLAKRARHWQDDATVPDTAMVMAAGLGKRMRPLTETRPKPLVEVAGKPLIDHVFDRLRSAGVANVVVNVHYLADLLEAHLKSVGDDLAIKVSDERDLLLETGGGMVRAEPLIGADPFLAINSDNFWTDGSSDTLRLLASHWREGEMDALLLLVPQARAGNHGGQGDFHIDATGRLSRRRTGHVAPYVYTGIQMVSKRLLRDAPAGPFSTNILWDRAIAEGRCFGAVHQGLWFDVGNPAAITATERALQDG